MRAVRPAHLLLGIVAITLALACRPPLVGQIADGRQMIFTAVALAETGSLGQARSRDLTVPRAGGDSVSRYGLAMSLAQVPAALLAPGLEQRNGPASSQWLFLVAPFLFVLCCGLLAARTVRLLGGTPTGEWCAVLLATVASPFGSYATLELSESLQALALIGAYAAALSGACDNRGRGGGLTPWVVAGMLIGLAVLTKSSLLVVAPLILTPVVLLPIGRRVAAAGAVAAGFVPMASVWLYFEIARFGRPLAGYAGEGFTHPFVDGLWRLMVGANRGLLLYFPAALLACIAVVRVARADARRGVAWSGTVLPIVALWMLAAPWWAWHGIDGWGPRLLVPGIPLLAIAAAMEVTGWSVPSRTAFILLSVALNLSPLVQHPTPVVRYLWTCAWPAAPPDAARQVPAFAQRATGDRVLIPPDQELATVASASPVVVLPWFFRAAHADPERRAAMLNAPPWMTARPDVRPDPPLSAERAAALADPRFAVYDAALADQVMRAQQLRQLDRALELARKLQSLAPNGASDALLLESFRLLGRKREAIDTLTSLSLQRRQNPAINVVLALWDRDEGREEEARVLLASSAASYPGTPTQRSVTAPLGDWPADFASMTANPLLEVRYN